MICWLLSGGIGIYKSFAGYYDLLTADIDYKKWADYIEDIFRKEGLKPGLILDLGCGTGSFCIEMASRGYEMIGVDSSPDMLSVAKEKALKRKLDILYLNQEMSDFELYGTVDAVVSLVDSINYLTRKRELLKTFRLVNNYLNPGGLFIFDINTRHKLSKTLGNNLFYSVSDDVTFIWQNSYSSLKHLCEFDLTFFVKEGELYRRFDEIHVERAYSTQEILDLINKSGLRLVDIYDELSFSFPPVKSQRNFFLCRK